MWDSLYVDAFQYLHFKSIEEIHDSVYKDYLMRMEAVRRNRLSKERDLHYLAYLNMVVESTEEKRKGVHVPVFKDFNNFFDYKKVKMGIVGETRDDKIEEIDVEKEILEDNSSRILELILEANRGGEE